MKGGGAAGRGCAAFSLMTHPTVSGLDSGRRVHCCPEYMGRMTKTPVLIRQHPEAFEKLALEEPCSCAVLVFPSPIPEASAVEAALFDDVSGARS